MRFPHLVPVLICLILECATDIGSLQASAAGVAPSRGAQSGARAAKGKGAKDSKAKSVEAQSARDPGVTAPGGITKGSRTGTLLVLAGPGAGEAHYEPASGWKTGSLNLKFSSASIAPRAGAAIAVLRGSSAQSPKDNELFWATWTKGSGFDAVQKVGRVGFATSGPSASPLGPASLATFLGIDFKHYYAENDAGLGYSVPGPIPGELVQNQAFGPSASSLAGDGGSGAYAVYAGNDSHIYCAYKAGPDSAWGASIKTPSSPASHMLRPSALVDSSKDLRIFYVRQSDKCICMVKLASAANTWTAEETVGAAAASLAPSAALMPDGNFVVAYVGALDQGVYFIRGKERAWGPIGMIEAPSTATAAPIAPIALPGLSGADAEIVYATGGILRDARLSGMSAPATAVEGVVDVTNLAAAIVP